jgi:hypothetical protein
MKRVTGVSRADLRQQWRKMNLLSGKRKVKVTAYLLLW